MNVSVTEMVMQRGSYTVEEEEELKVAMGGGLSIVRDNTLEVSGLIIWLDGWKEVVGTWEKARAANGQ